MPEGIGASGYVGFAFEAVPGTYVAPTKFIPVNNETLQYMGEPQYRRPIRQSADVVWAVPSDAHIEGDIEMDALDDCVLYFLRIARTACIKSGTTNFTYTFTPTAGAIPVVTASITVNRNGVIFAYTGCVVSSFTFAINEGVLSFNVSVLGRDEATQAAPGAVTWGTTTPYGAGTYNLEVPTGSTVNDSDSFELTIEDSGEPQFRNKTGRGAAFIKYGERNVGLTLGRDFVTKTDYDSFKAITAQAVSLTATKSANNSIAMTIASAIKNSYELGLTGQGDLLRGQIEYTGIQHVSNPTYSIVVKTQEDIVVA
jgi:hypothetical protein